MTDPLIISGIVGGACTLLGKLWGTYAERTAREQILWAEGKEMLDHAQARAREAESALNEVRDQLNKVLLSQALTETHVRALEAKIDQLTVEMESWKEKLDQADAEIAERDQTIEDLENAIETLELRLNEELKGTLGGPKP